MQRCYKSIIVADKLTKDDYLTLGSTPGRRCRFNAGLAKQLIKDARILLVPNTTIKSVQVHYETETVLIIDIIDFYAVHKIFNFGRVPKQKVALIVIL